MKKNDHKLKNVWQLCKQSFSVFIVLTSCQIPSKNKKFAVDQAFVVQWSYLSDQKKTYPVTSPIFIKGNQFLRVDFTAPFRGSLGRFVLNKNKALFQNLLKKEFYRGDFNSQILLPEFESFPASWLFALLKAEPLKNWKCSSVSQNKKTCQAKGLKVEWIFKNSQWEQADLTSSHQEKIKIKKLKKLKKRFQNDIFILNLKGYKQQKKFSLE